MAIEIAEFNTGRRQPSRESRSLLRLELGEGGLDRLDRFLGDGLVELAELGRLGDEAFVGRLGEFRLKRDRLVQLLHADQLLDEGGAFLEGLLGIVASFGGDRLEALGDFLQGGRGGFELLFAELLERFEIISHGRILERWPASGGGGDPSGPKQRLGFSCTAQKSQPDFSQCKIARIFMI